MVQLMSFYKRFQELRIDRETVLCVGLDPALPRQRDKDVISRRYLDLDDENEERLSFCLDIMDLVHESALAIKPNQQYVFGFGKKHHQKLTDYARKRDMLSVLDYKLNDISDTVASAIFHLSESGYDAVTFNPLPGNLQEAVNLAHTLGTRTSGHELGIIVLTLMSNPEAAVFMRRTRLGKIPLYKYIAMQVKKHNADGCVVGATGHVSEKDVRAIRRIIGPDRVFLIPGVGAQKGDARKVLKVAGENVLINVGRDIIYSENPKLRAQKYRAEFLAIERGKST